MCITINNLPIGVFDSGVGGLTAVKQLRLLVPNENIVYFGDTARVPYGTRNSETIIKYAKDDINVLLSKGVKIIVAACGTVSSTLPQTEIEKLPIPYLGVVESTAHAAVNATKNGKIGIIGTDATIKSNSYKNIINALQPNYETFCVACPLFVPLVENGFIEKDNSVTLTVAHNYLDEIKSKGVDTLILGCTHYPIISEIIKAVMGDGVTLIDPGHEIAKEVLTTLKQNDLCTESTRTGSAQYFVSDSVDGFTALAKIFLDDYVDGSIAQVKI